MLTILKLPSLLIKNIKYIALILITFFIFSIINAKDKEIKQLKTEYAKLKSQYENLTIKYHALEENYTVINELHSQCKISLDKLSKEYETLQDLYSECEFNMLYNDTFNTELLDKSSNNYNNLKTKKSVKNNGNKKTKKHKSKKNSHIIVENEIIFNFDDPFYPIYKNGIKFDKDDLVNNRIIIDF